MTQKNITQKNINQKNITQQTTTIATNGSETTDALGQALTAMGLEPSRRFGVMLWTGQYEGRAVTLRISRQGRTRYAGEVRYRQQLGFRLRIELQTKVLTRFYLVPAAFANSGLMRRIYRWRGTQVIDKAPEALTNFRGVARDAPWGERLLACSELIDDIAGLLTERTHGGLQGSVYFEPETLHYGSGILQRADFEVDWVRSILERLARIAAVADHLPPPQRQDKPSRFAGLARRRPLLAALLMLGGFVGVLMVFALVLVLILSLIAIGFK
ncbi:MULTISPECIES: hypothetical protein [Thiorhodovibrio]|uniref:hypothetical protein n=1 Tax=Thiorhodovibrio TaxID=61593 RepID=UPI001913F21C|nr:MULTISPECIES: hypothetical protein [Thiorhodovibrio]